MNVHKMATTQYIVSLLLLFCPVILTAQVFFSISKEIKGDSLLLKGVVQNRTDKNLTLGYAMYVTKVDTGGNNTENKQENIFTIAPNTIVPFTQIQVNITDQMYVEAILNLIFNGKVIDTDTLRHGTKPSQKIVPLKNAITPQVSSAFDAIEIDGLILDETRSKSARDFYEIFYNKWSPPQGARDYSITIKELPSRGRSARIMVQVNDTALFQRFLQPRLEVIEAVVDQAIQVIRRHLSENESMKRQMGSEDQKGSGIF